ncbi:MAG: hypothetical protein KJ893_03310 [Candidatus Omnitrophica bacterium]|nr:hypothetical protein [Candidatus Omnitrophota bacterium]
MKINKRLLKIIVLLLIQAFVAMDIAWAQGIIFFDNSLKKQSSALAPKLCVSTEWFSRVYAELSSSRKRINYGYDFPGFAGDIKGAADFVINIGAWMDKRGKIRVKIKNLDNIGRWPGLEWQKDIVRKRQKIIKDKLRKMFAERRKDLKEVLRNTRTKRKTFKLILYGRAGKIAYGLADGIYLHWAVLKNVPDEHIGNFLEILLFNALESLLGSGLETDLVREKLLKKIESNPSYLDALIYILNPENNNNIVSESGFYRLIRFKKAERSRAPEDLKIFLEMVIPETKDGYLRRINLKSKDIRLSSITDYLIHDIISNEIIALLFNFKTQGVEKIEKDYELNLAEKAKELLDAGELLRALIEFFALKTESELGEIAGNITDRADFIYSLFVKCLYTSPFNKWNDVLNDIYKLRDEPNINTTFKIQADRFLRLKEQIQALKDLFDEDPDLERAKKAIIYLSGLEDDKIDLIIKKQMLSEEHTAWLRTAIKVQNEINKIILPDSQWRGSPVSERVELSTDHGISPYSTIAHIEAPEITIFNLKDLAVYFEKSNILVQFSYRPQLKEKMKFLNSQLQELKRVSQKCDLPPSTLFLQQQDGIDEDYLMIRLGVDEFQCAKKLFVDKYGEDLIQLAI